MKHFIITVQMILVAALTAGYIKESIRALDYEAAYESARADAESLQRTVGRAIAPAYTCKLRAQKRAVMQFVVANEDAAR